MEELDYILSKENLHIVDSYLIEDPMEMENYIHLIRVTKARPDYAISKLPMKYMVDEWKAHNLYYKMGLWRSHTKDVDINENDLKNKICYWTAARLYDVYYFFKKLF